MLLAYLHDWRISLSIAISRSLAKGAYIGAYFPTVLDLLASRYVLSLSIKFVSNWFKCPLKLSSSFVYSPSSKHQISSQSLQTPVKPSFLPSPSLTEKKSPPPLPLQPLHPLGTSEPASQWGWWSHLYPASSFFVATNQRFSCSMDWSQGTLTRNCGFYL